MKFFVNNWFEALDPSFGIPTDIAFAFVDENGDSSNIAAHKYLLAMASPVFKAMFFGPAKETKEVVQMKETNKEAFSLMIDYIYGKEVCWEGKRLLLLLEVVNLAEMYNLEDLMMEVEFSLAVLSPPTSETVMDVALAAEMFSHFEKISSLLFVSCAMFLADEVLFNKEQFREFVTKHMDGPHYNIASKLLKMARSVKCENCLHVECRDRRPLLIKKNMRKGCRVFFRIGSSRVQVVGNLVEKCKGGNGTAWWIKQEDEFDGFEEKLLRVKLRNLFFACER